MTPLEIDAVAAGGDGIGRLEGKAVFVPGAIPGDVAEVVVVSDKRGYARARIERLVTPSPDRIAMPCRHAADCGGCTWQMADRSVQLGWKQRITEDALARIGHFTQADVRPIAAPGPPFAYRNRLDLHPSADGPGFYRAGTHDPLAVQVCLLAAPPVEALLDSVKLRPVAGGLTLRAGLRTGEAVVIGPGHAAPSEAVITEIVGGVRFQITGRAFFQPNTDGAEALARLVREAAGRPGGTLVDAYAGVGLFAGVIGNGYDRVVSIEAGRVAAGDLRANVPAATVLAMPAPAGLRRVDVRPSVVIVDPPRQGLGREVVGRLVEMAAPVVVSVSCDPATFARDSRMLVDGGYTMEWVAPVDQFPQTPHVETVARFTR